MPQYKLINGALHRDGQPQLCPFYSRVPMPVQTKLQHGVGINERICGLACPLFSVTETETGQSDPDVPDFATLHCASKPRQFDVEVVVEKKSLAKAN
jgi:hypothetical protein